MWFKYSWSKWLNHLWTVETLLRHRRCAKYPFRGLTKLKMVEIYHLKFEKIIGQICQKECQLTTASSFDIEAPCFI